ncbi:MAG: potassium uptake protein TrkH family [Anaerosporomusa subterranea]|nr:potassium uptake protein TrkH family [Anaerosporomusa subterranea]
MKAPIQLTMLKRLISGWHVRLSPYQFIAIGFAGTILLGACLLSTSWASAKPGYTVSFLDALFTATSAVCVTGLIVVDTGTTYSLFGQLVLIGLIQVGGLGIMSITTLVALLMGKKIKLKERLIMQEALNQLSMEGVVRLTLYIIKVTLMIEFIGGTILALRWMPEFGLKGIYYGYWHAVSSFCNAGFDLFGEFRSLTGYVDDVTVNLVVTTLIILGGIGFAVISDIWTHRNFSHCSIHTKVVLVTTVILLVGGTLGIFLLEYNNTLANLSWPGKLLGSYFQSVTVRTAGYNTLDIGKMEDATLFFMVLLMFVGASPGSTGGGIKTSTAAVLVAAMAAMTRGSQDAQVFRRRIPQFLVYKSFTVVFIAALLVILVTMVLSITETFPFINILFEVTSAFGTVGLTTGITTSLSDHGKVALIITMFAGRIGPITLVLALALRERKGLIQYPEGKIIIG